MEEAVHEVEKVPGIVNVVDPQYQVEIGEKTYFLWIQEGSGTIMDLTDTHTIYTLSDQSVKKVNELLASQFGGITSRH